MKRYIKSSEPVSLPDATDLVCYKGMSQEFKIDYDNYSEIGLHCGSTLEQANEVDLHRKPKRYIYRLHIPQCNLLKISRDLGYSSPINFANELLQSFEHKELLNKIRGKTLPEQCKLCREWLKDHGFDGISYENSVESEGESYIITNMSKIKSDNVELIEEKDNI